MNENPRERKKPGLRRTWMFLAAAFFLCLLEGSAAEAATSSKPASPLARFTKEELSRLEKGEAVYRYVEKKDDKGKIKGHGEAYILIKRPAKECFQEFIKFDRHHLYFPRKKKSEILKREGDRTWVRKVFDFYLIDVEYTVIYTVDPERLQVDFKMDKSYPHDLKEVEGFFKFEPVSPELTLFTYAATRVDTGLKVPGFIQEYISSRDLPAVAVNVKKRMESRGKWEK